jgi:xanthine dehydrogenase accessory factor
MKEFKAIIEAYNSIDFTMQKAALATVVKVRGSSYRSPGARMLITDNGKWVGSISGGCLEGDALRKARQVINSKRAMTVTYDTREESNQNLGIGLGCNGVIDVLIEPIDSNNLNNPLYSLKKLINSTTPFAIATIYHGDVHVGEKLLLKENGELITSTPDEKLNQLLIPDLLAIFNTLRCQSKKYILDDRAYDVFIELVIPTVSLILFGGGFDARPVSLLAKTLGWDVTVTDECVSHIAPAFFPTADKLSLCHRQFVERDFTITPFTACVLMSHNYEYDRDVLRSLLKSETPYIGILGPRKRFDKMLTDFEREGIVISPERMNSIHSPIGLDIGAETPDEIALSIISEIQAKFSSRSGGFLKYRSGPIHSREGADDQVFKQVYINPSFNTDASSTG